MAFTTVSLDGRLTVWEALAGWLDPDVDVVSEDVVLQGRTPKESQQVNLQLMDDAKDTATQVALVELGLSRAAGAEVVDVVPDSPAQAVLTVGDVVTAIDGQPITSSSELVQAIGARRPGDEVSLTLQRGRGRRRRHPRETTDGHGGPGRQRGPARRPVLRRAGQDLVRQPLSRTTSASTAVTSSARRPAWPSRWA